MSRWVKAAPSAQQHQRFGERRPSIDVHDSIFGISKKSNQIEKDRPMQSSMWHEDGDGTNFTPAAGQSASRLVYDHVAGPLDRAGPPVLDSAQRRPSIDTIEDHLFPRSESYKFYSQSLRDLKPDFSSLGHELHVEFQTTLDLIKEQLVADDATPIPVLLAERLQMTFSRFRDKCEAEVRDLVSSLHSDNPCHSPLSSAEGVQLYLIDGIAFSVLHELDAAWSPFASVCAVHKLAGNELRNTSNVLDFSIHTHCSAIPNEHNLFAFKDLHGFRCPLMLLLDFGGVRVMAQTVVPLSQHSLCIGSTDAGTNLCFLSDYGDNNKHLANNEAVVYVRSSSSASPSAIPSLCGMALLPDVLYDNVCRSFKLKEQLIKSESKETEVLFYTSPNVEIHVSEDGHVYLLNTASLLPSNVHPLHPNRFYSAVHQFRAEFMTTYSKFLCSFAHSEWLDSVHRNKLLSETEKAREILESTVIKRCSNHLIGVLRSVLGKLSITRLMQSLYDHIAIHEMCREEILLSIHSFGINFRYLPLLYSAVSIDACRTSFRKYLCNILVVEIVARSIKQLIRSQWRRSSFEKHVSVFWHVCSALFHNSLYFRKCFVCAVTSHFGESCRLWLNEEAESLPGLFEAVCTDSTSSASWLAVCIHRVCALCGVSLTVSVPNFIESMRSSQEPPDTLDSFISIRVTCKELYLSAYSQGLLALYQHKSSVHSSVNLRQCIRTLYSATSRLPLRSELHLQLALGLQYLLGTVSQSTEAKMIKGRICIAYERALQVEPHNGSLYPKVAKWYIAQGNLNRACELSFKCICTSSQTFLSWDTLFHGLCFALAAEQTSALLRKIEYSFNYRETRRGTPRVLDINIPAGFCTYVAYKAAVAVDDTEAAAKYLAAFENIPNRAICVLLYAQILASIPRSDPVLLMAACEQYTEAMSSILEIEVNAIIPCFAGGEKIDWIPDDNQTGCFQENCGKKFTLRTRRHHCRQCGNVFCDSCCAKRRYASGYTTRERVCDECAFVIDQKEAAWEERGSFEPDDASDDEEALAIFFHLPTYYDDNSLSVTKKLTEFIECSGSLQAHSTACLPWFLYHYSETVQRYCELAYESELDLVPFYEFVANVFELQYQLAPNALTAKVISGAAVPLARELYVELRKEVIPLIMMQYQLSEDRSDDRTMFSLYMLVRAVVAVKPFVQNSCIIGKELSRLILTIERYMKWSLRFIEMSGERKRSPDTSEEERRRFKIEQKCMSSYLELKQFEIAMNEAYGEDYSHAQLHMPASLTKPIDHD